MEIFTVAIPFPTFSLFFLRLSAEFYLIAQTVHKLIS